MKGVLGKVRKLVGEGFFFIYYLIYIISRQYSQQGRVVYGHLYLHKVKQQKIKVPSKVQTEGT